MGYSFPFSFLQPVFGGKESESDQGVTSARCGLEGEREREHTCLFLGLRQGDTQIEFRMYFGRGRMAQIFFALLLDPFKFL